MTAANSSSSDSHPIVPPCAAEARSRRRRRRVAVAAVAGLALYNGAAFVDYGETSSSSTDPFGPLSSSLRGGRGRGGPDLDHFVPPNRFLLAEDPAGDDGSTKKTGGFHIRYDGPRSVTLTPRSPDDARSLRQDQATAARKRAGVAEETSLERLAPEVAASVLRTANQFDVPNDRKHRFEPYDIDSALLAARAFHREVLFFVYDSATDDFVVLHNLPECTSGCVRAYAVAPVLAYALRKNYPERFEGSTSGDLAFLISVGDMPRIRRPCLFPESKFCKSADWAPVLQFGSVLADPTYMPTVVAMPPRPRPHVPCFGEYQTTGEVCQDLKPRLPDQEQQSSNAPIEEMGAHFKHGLVFGQEMGLTNTPHYWNDLVPQVVWRGSDFAFMHTLFPDMRSPSYGLDLAPVEETFGEDATRGAIKALWDLGEDKITPRWRGVLLGAEAELEAREAQAKRGVSITAAPVLPWADIKFASCNVDGVKVPASQCHVHNPDYGILAEKFGIRAAGEPLSMTQQAKHRYHLDLGGGGGTTWTGTLEKLALPGLLFHHVTPARDWFHPHLKPWEHYVPVRSDLADLREKYEWAESHPREAQAIAEAGTAFARTIGTEEGFDALYKEHFVAPLGHVIANYKQPRKKYGRKKVLDILRESEFHGVKEEFGIVARCGGWPAESAECRWTARRTVEPSAAEDLVGGDVETLEGMEEEATRLREELRGAEEELEEEEEEEDEEEGWEPAAPEDFFAALAQEEAALSEEHGSVYL